MDMEKNDTFVLVLLLDLIVRISIKFNILTCLLQ